MEADPPDADLTFDDAPMTAEDPPQSEPNEYDMVNLRGIDSAGVTMTLIATAPFELSVTELTCGIEGIKPLPPWVIPSAHYYSFLTLVNKGWILD